MKKYLQLTSDKGVMIINVDRIVMIMKYENGKSYIRFTDGYNQVFDETVEQIYEKLKDNVI